MMSQAELQADLAPKPNPGDVEIPNRIFVKGFGRETSEEDLKIFFERYGIVRESKIVKEKSTGQSKGYAFITFDSQDVAEKMKEQLTVQYNNKEIVIGPARIRKKRPFYRTRQDQLWSPLPLNNLQQPMYYSVAPDGMWYFQPPPPVTQMVSMVPQLSAMSQYGNVPQQPTSWQPTHITPTPTFNQPHFYPNSGSNLGITSPVSNQALYSYEFIQASPSVSDVLKPVKTAVSPSPTSDSTDSVQNAGCSPVQCVPVYDGMSLLSDECIVNLANETQNLVVIDANDRKIKRVLMKRDSILSRDPSMSPLPTSAEP